MSENFQVNPKIVFRKEVDSAFLFNPENNDLYVLNLTGMHIWQMCDKGATKRKIIDSLMKKFDIDDSNKAEKDVDSFLKALKERGFLKKRGQATLFGQGLTIKSKGKPPKG